MIISDRVIEPIGQKLQVLGNRAEIKGEGVVNTGLDGDQDDLSLIVLIRREEKHV